MMTQRLRFQGGQLQGHSKVPLPTPPSTTAAQATYPDRLDTQVLGFGVDVGACGRDAAARVRLPKHMQGALPRQCVK